jgi:hypothetical protein
MGKSVSDTSNDPLGLRAAYSKNQNTQPDADDPLGLRKEFKKKSGSDSNDGLDTLPDFTGQPLPSKLASETDPNYTNAVQFIDADQSKRATKFEQLNQSVPGYNPFSISNTFSPDKPVTDDPQKLRQYLDVRGREINDQINALTSEQSKYIKIGGSAGEGAPGFEEVVDPENYNALQKKKDALNNYYKVFRQHAEAIAEKKVVESVLAKTNSIGVPSEIGREIVKISQPEYDAQISALEKSGSPNLGGQVNYELERLGLDATRKYLAANKNSPNWDSHVQDLQQWEGESDERNFEMTASRVREKIAAYLYKKSGFLSSIGRSPTTYGEASLKEAASNPETGLTPSEKKVFDTYVLPLEKKVIGTTFPVSGFLPKAALAIEKNVVGLTNIFRSDQERLKEGLNQRLDVSGNNIGDDPDAQQQLDYLRKNAVTNEEQDKIKQLEKYVGVRNWYNKFMDGAGDLTGQVVYQAVLARLTGGLGSAIGEVGGVIGKAAQVGLASQNGQLYISSFLTAYDNYAKQAALQMPGEENALGRRLYSFTMSAVEGLSEKIFNDTKVLDAFKKEVSPDVVAMVKKLSSGGITAEAAKVELSRMLKEKLTPFAKYFLKSEFEESTEEGVTDIADGISQSVFGGQTFDMKKTGAQALNTFMTTMLYSPFVAAAAAKNEVRTHTFDKAALYRMASNPGDYKAEISRQLANDEISREQANEKFQLLNTANKLLSHLPEKDNFDYPTQATYLMHGLNEAILENKMSKTEDENVKADLQTELTRSKEIRKGIYNSEIIVGNLMNEFAADEDKAKQLGIPHVSQASDDDLHSYTVSTNEHGSPVVTWDFSKIANNENKNSEGKNAEDTKGQGQVSEDQATKDQQSALLSVLPDDLAQTISTPETESKPKDELLSALHAGDINELQDDERHTIYVSPNSTIAANAALFGEGLTTKQMGKNMQVSGSGSAFKSFYEKSQQAQKIEEAPMVDPVDEQKKPGASEQVQEEQNNTETATVQQQSDNELLNKLGVNHQDNIDGNHRYSFFVPNTSSIVSNAEVVGNNISVRDAGNGQMQVSGKGSDFKELFEKSYNRPKWSPSVMVIQNENGDVQMLARPKQKVTAEQQQQESKQTQEEPNAAEQPASGVLSEKEQSIVDQIAATPDIAKTGTVGQQWYQAAQDKSKHRSLINEMRDQSANPVQLADALGSAQLAGRVISLGPSSYAQQQDSGGTFSPVKTVKTTKINVDSNFKQGKAYSTAVRHFVKNQNAAQPITLYQHPNGKIYVLDGRARLKAAKKLGNNYISARYFRGTVEEAASFADQQTQFERMASDQEARRKKLEFQRRKAKVLSKDPESFKEAVLQFLLNGGAFSREDVERFTGFGVKDTNRLSMNFGQMRGYEEIRMAVLMGSIKRAKKGGMQFDQYVQQYNNYQNDFGKEQDMMNELADLVIGFQSQEKMLNELEFMQGVSETPMAEDFNFMFGLTEDEIETFNNKQLKDFLYADPADLNLSPEELAHLEGVVNANVDAETGNLDVQGAYDAIFKPAWTNESSTSLQKKFVDYIKQLDNDTNGESTSELPENTSNEESSGYGQQGTNSDQAQTENTDRAKSVELPTIESLSNVGTEFYLYDKTARLGGQVKYVVESVRKEDGDTFITATNTKTGVTEAIGSLNDRIGEIRHQTRMQQQQMSEETAARSGWKAVSDEDLFLQHATNQSTPISIAELGITGDEDVHGLLDKLIAYNGPFTEIFKFIKGLPGIGEIKFQLLQPGKDLLLDKLMTKFTLLGYDIPLGIFFRKNGGTEYDGKLLLRDAGNAYYTMAHELMHYLTLDNDVMQKFADPEKLRLLENIYHFVRSAKGLKEFSNETYGLSNFHEFMAELLLNPDLRNFVSDVYAKSRNQFAEQAFKARVQGAKSLGEIIIDFVRHVFDRLFNGSAYSVDTTRPIIDQAVDLAGELFLNPAALEMRNSGPATVILGAKRVVKSVVDRISGLKYKLKELVKPLLLPDHREQTSEEGLRTDMHIYKTVVDLVAFPYGERCKRYL